MTQTIQNSNFGFSLLNAVPPPEGLMGVKIGYAFTPALYNYATTYQLSSQNGFPLSQVLSLYIDNTANATPIVVTHGVTGATVAIPGWSAEVVPTFSSKGAPYPISIEAAYAPQGNMQVYVTFLNYSHSSASIKSGALIASSGGSGSIATQLPTAPNFAWNAQTLVAAVSNVIVISPLGQFAVINAFDLYLSNITAGGANNLMVSLGTGYLQAPGSTHGNWNSVGAWMQEISATESSGNLARFSGLSLPLFPNQSLYLSFATWPAIGLLTGGWCGCNVYGNILPSGS